MDFVCFINRPFLYFATAHVNYYSAKIIIIVVLSPGYYITYAKRGRNILSNSVKYFNLIPW